MYRRTRIWTSRAWRRPHHICIFLNELLSWTCLFIPLSQWAWVVSRGLSLGSPNSAIVRLTMTAWIIQVSDKFAVQEDAISVVCSREMEDLPLQDSSGSRENYTEEPARMATMFLNFISVWEHGWNTSNQGTPHGGPCKSLHTRIHALRPKSFENRSSADVRTFPFWILASVARCLEYGCTVEALSTIEKETVNLHSHPDILRVARSYVVVQNSICPPKKNVGRD